MDTALMRKNLRARSSLRTFATSSSSYAGCQFRSSLSKAVVFDSGVVDMLMLEFRLREGLWRGGAAVEGGTGRRIVSTGAEELSALS